MKVKELIKWLKTKNQEDFVGIFDIGMDSGNWIDLQESKYDNKKNSLSILQVFSFEEAINSLKKSSLEDLNEFKKRYDKKSKEKKECKEIDMKTLWKLCNKVCGWIDDDGGFHKEKGEYSTYLEIEDLKREIERYLKTIREVSELK